MHHLLVQLKEPSRWNSCKQHQNVDRESTEIHPGVVSFLIAFLIFFFLLLLYSANLPITTHLQRHRQKLQSAALQYRISGVTEPVRRGFMFRPAVAGCVGKRQCVGNVCGRCYHWAYTNLSRSGSRFLNHTLIKTWPIVTDWRADTCPFERRHCGNGSHSAAPLNFTKQTAVWEDCRLWCATQSGCCSTRCDTWRAGVRKRFLCGVITQWRRLTGHIISADGGVFFFLR